MTSSLNIGKKIRELRLSRNINLRELSKLCGISASLISQIENNRVTPSIKTLKKISENLGEKASFFLEDEESGKNSHQLLTNKVYLRKGDRKIWKRNKEGMIYELLNPSLYGKKMEFVYLKMQPGYSIDELFTHEGEECGLILQGHVQLLLEDKIYDLNVGDSVYYLSTTPHGLRNIGENTAHAIFAITPPSF
jgi:transcriptional regulator with XRE-family HTH domain